MSPTVIGDLEITGPIAPRHVEVLAPGAGASLADGRTIDSALYDRFMAEELVKIQGEIGADRFTRGNFPKAVEMFLRMVKAERFDEFLTLPAYEQLA